MHRILTKLTWMVDIELKTIYTKFYGSQLQREWSFGCLKWSNFRKKLGFSSFLSLRCGIGPRLQSWKKYNLSFCVCLYYWYPDTVPITTISQGVKKLQIVKINKRQTFEQFYLEFAFLSWKYFLDSLLRWKAFLVRFLEKLNQLISTICNFSTP